MMTVATTVTLKDVARNSGVARCTSGSGPHPKWTDGFPCSCPTSTNRGGGHSSARGSHGSTWARWHDDGTLKATRANLAGLEDGPSSTVWYDVVEEQS